MILNYEYISKIAGSNHDIIVELYQTFIDSAPDYIAALESAKNPDERKAAAHRLKGAAANMGAETLAESCKVAQFSASNSPDWSAAMNQVLIQLELTLLQMNDAINKR